MQIFGSMYFSDGAIIALCWDFPGGSDGNNLPAMRETQV